MLGWIEKVVPQPPASSFIPAAMEKAAKAEEEPAEGNARERNEQPKVPKGFQLESHGARYTDLWV